MSKLLASFFLGPAEIISLSLEIIGNFFFFYQKNPQPIYFLYVLCETLTRLTQAVEETRVEAFGDCS